MGIEEKNIEELAEEYVELFNKDFGTSLKIKHDKYGMIARLYEIAIQEYNTSPLYKKILHEIVNLEEEILDKYSDEDNLLFQKWEKLISRIHSDELLQVFILGFCSAKQIEIEQNDSDNFNDNQF